MIRRPPRSTRTFTLFPYTTLFRRGYDCLGSPGVILTSELRHRVRAVPAPRVAACDPARGEPSPLQRPIAAERLDCIGRTTRLIAAGRRQERRRTELPERKSGVVGKSGSGRLELWGGRKN